MAKQRTRLQAGDLLNGALIRSSKTGNIYRLGPPKKINVNLNVVNHCQLYYRNGRLVGIGKWLNLTNLREHGFTLYTPSPTGWLSRPADAPPMTPKVATALTEMITLAHQQITNPDGLPS